MAIGEVWSSNLRDLDVESYTPESTFPKTIFRPQKGAVPQNFYTR